MKCLIRASYIFAFGILELHVEEALFSPGWYPMLARLDARLSAIAPGYILQQCKSKFGSLAFYAAPSDDVSEYNEEFNEAIRAAEWESIETCEVCGAPGAQYVINLWVSVLCPKHHHKAIRAADTEDAK